MNISARPDLVTHQLQILAPITEKCQKGQFFILAIILEDGLFRKCLIITTKKSELEILFRNNCWFKKEPVQKTKILGDLKGDF